MNIGEVDGRTRIKVKWGRGMDEEEELHFTIFLGTIYSITTMESIENERTDGQTKQGRVDKRFLDFPPPSSPQKKKEQRNNSNF